MSNEPENDNRYPHGEAPMGDEAGTVNVEIHDTAPGDNPESGIQDESAEADPLANLTQENAALRDQLLRARAEFDNFRKRKAREMDQIRKTAADGLIRDLLPVVDNLERALDHAEDRAIGLAQGVEMVLKQLKSVLAQQGLEAIPALGQPFDPNLHEAMSHQPSDEHPADSVMLEYERGYTLGDGVLRPAKVVVSSGPAENRDAN